MTGSLFHSLYQDGSGRQCLLIERVMKSDAGWYTLSAINEAGMSTCNARLDVGSKSSSFLGCLLYEIVAGSYHSSPACKIKQQMENVVHPARRPGNTSNKCRVTRSSGNWMNAGGVEPSGFTEHCIISEAPGQVR